MAGYLDSYGVADQKRSKRIWRIVIPTVIVALIGVFLYFFFRNFREERVAKSFLQALQKQDYDGAYRIWGCPPPCANYSKDKFMEDWGPKGLYANAKAAHISTIDSCGDGVVFTLNFPKIDPFGLQIDRETRTITFAPWPRCPGRHWHLWDFIKSKFS